MAADHAGCSSSRPTASVWSGEATVGHRPHARRARSASWPNHAPMLSVLAAGSGRRHAPTNDGTWVAAVDGGFLSVAEQPGLDPVRARRDVARDRPREGASAELERATHGLRDEARRRPERGRIRAVERRRPATRRKERIDAGMAVARRRGRCRAAARPALRALSGHPPPAGSPATAAPSSSPSASGPPGPGAAGFSGVGRYSGDRLEWFRIFSPCAAPAAFLARWELRVSPAGATPRVPRRTRPVRRPPDRGLPDPDRAGRGGDEPVGADRLPGLARGAPPGHRLGPAAQALTAQSSSGTRSPPGFQSTSPCSRLACRARMKSRSREPVEVLDRQDVHRLAVLGAGRPGGALGPPDHRAGHVQLRRAGRAAGEDERAQRSAGPRCSGRTSPRAGRCSPARPAAAGTRGRSTTGVQRSAPTSNRSFWTWVSTATTSSSSPPAAMATPICALASSTSAYACSRRSVFVVALMSPRRVSPASPVRV